MSTCISKHGEYSEHGPLTDGYWCEWCGALDEAAMRKGIESAVREQVARDIEYAESMSRASLIERPKIGPGEFLNDWQWAAKIARGGAS